MKTFNFPVSTLLDNIFNRSIGDLIGSDFNLSMPAINVVESDKDYQLHIAAPGLNKSDFTIKSDKGYLTISANKEVSEEEVKPKFLRKEFNFTSFTRSFQLPENANVEGISAQYTDGILLVTMPKKVQVEVSPVEIEIK